MKVQSLQRRDLHSHHKTHLLHKYVPQHLETYEIELGYKPIWISVDEAISKNVAKLALLKDTDYSGVLERELRILNALKESGF